MRRTQGRRGMSLVEVMVGVLILGATVLAASAMFPLSAFLRDRSGTYSRAATIAQRKLEQIRKLPTTQLTYTGLLNAGVIDQGNNEPYSFTTVDSVAGELAQGAGTIELIDEGTDLVRVDVRVTWKSLRGTDMNLQATSMVSNKEFWVEQ